VRARGSTWDLCSSVMKAYTDIPAKLLLQLLQKRFLGRKPTSLKTFTILACGGIVLTLHLELTCGGTVVTVYLKSSTTRLVECCETLLGIDV